MKPARFSWSMLTMVAVMAFASSGCTTKLIGDAARTSATSFLNSIFSAAVNDVFGPQ